MACLCSPQSEGVKKKGSVKAETSLSALELSGAVIKRGYLLKQVTTPGFKTMKTMRFV